MIISVFDRPKPPWPIRLAAIAPVVLWALAFVLTLVVAATSRCGPGSAPECGMFDPLIWLFAVVSLVAAALAWAVGKALKQGALWAWYLMLAVHSIISIWGIKIMVSVEYWDNPVLLLAHLPATAVSAFVVGALLHPASLRWRGIEAERRAASRERHDGGRATEMPNRDQADRY